MSVSYEEVAAKTCSTYRYTTQLLFSSLDIIFALVGAQVWIWKIAWNSEMRLIPDCFDVKVQQTKSLLLQSLHKRTSRTAVGKCFVTVRIELTLKLTYIHSTAKTEVIFLF